MSLTATADSAVLTAINTRMVTQREKCGTFEKGGGCFDEYNPPRNPLYGFRD